MLVERLTPVVLLGWSAAAVALALSPSPFLLRVLVVGGLLITGTGAAVTRHLPGIEGAAAGAVILGTSIAVLVLVSEAYVFLGLFNAWLVFMTVIAINLAVAAVPSTAALQRPWVWPR